jgi:hypothetical protein
MDIAQLVSELVGEVFPVALPVGRGRLRRNWVLRVAAQLPSDPDLDRLANDAEEQAFAAIRQAYGSSVPEDQLRANRPAVRIARLGASHLIVRVEFCDTEASVGDSAAISQWLVLQEVDRVLRLEDLQGLPCELWFQIRSAREGRNKP